MKHLATVSALAVAALLAAAPAAHAQASRTWVSGTGSDANPCSRTAPCQTWAGALSKTANGGEISALDPGGFGAVTINKSITLNGEGTLAGILAALVNGVVVNAGPNDRVVIRNLSINGVGTGINGIRFLAGKTLLVENCFISGFTGRGIDVALGATGTFLVKDTTITNVQTGVRATTNAGLALGLLDNVRIFSQLASDPSIPRTNGVEAAANARITISDSVLSGLSGTGVLVSAAGGLVTVEGSQIAFNDIAGVNASVAGATIRLSNNEIYNNTAGIVFAGGATVASTGNNRVEGNGSTQFPNATINGL